MRLRHEPALRFLLWCDGELVVDETLTNGDDVTARSLAHGELAAAARTWVLRIEDPDGVLPTFEYRSDD